MKLKALVPTGHGINCESETCRALELGGFNVIDPVHLNLISMGRVRFSDYHLVVFPGGFLDGDDLGAAQACANRLRRTVVDGRSLLDALISFTAEGGLVLGICNGFQLLAKLGMLPATDGHYSRRRVTLAANDSGRFEDRWVWLAVDEASPCIFTKGLSRVYLPVRHGEGKIVCSAGEPAARLVKDGRAPLRYSGPDTSEPTMSYPDNPNGSELAIAGICDPSGRVFGMMPHPEAFLDRTNHPRWTREDVSSEGQGMFFFRNAAKYVRESRPKRFQV
jgi:phosphoribosylformylglycinamidine synthase subunit PurQ / glutaminase